MPKPVDRGAGREHVRGTHIACNHPKLINRLAALAWFGVAGAVGVALFAATPVFAQDAISQFYKGKQITITVGTPAGTISMRA